MYPLLHFNKQKILENTKAIVERAAAQGVTVTAITKCAAGNPEVATAFLQGGAAALGDSRIKNLKGLRDFDCAKWLIRIPMISEAEDAVRYATLSLNSELATIEALNAAAQKQQKKHQVLMMVDLGDLREGYFDVKALYESVDAARKLKHIEVVGIAANSACIGATIPEPAAFDKLFEVKHHLNTHFDLPCDIVSGDNSSAYYMIEDGTLPKGITNLRFGELLLFGNETAYGKAYDYLHQSIFTLETEIVEIKEKPSYPIGKIGVDAFGHTPVFEDKGIRKRAICALGKQDTSIDDITPFDTDLTIIGASSDHLVIDISDSSTNYHVGDKISFDCNYVSLLHAATSEYVDKAIH